MALEKKEPKRLGEVVECSTSQFTAQCYDMNAPPALGEMVRVGQAPIYGVVCNVTTQPFDPGRRILARGEDAPSEDDLYRDNPQLAKLLHTRFQALTVGYAYGSAIRHHLPRAPPRIHAFVYGCADDEVAHFTQSADFLHVILASNQPVTDEVASACLRRAAVCHPDPNAFLVKAGKTVATELSGQMARLNSILRGLKT